MPLWRLLLLVLTPIVFFGEALPTAAAGAEAWTLRIEGNGLALGATPIEVALPDVDADSLAPGPHRLVPGDGSPPLPAFVFNTADGRKLGAVVPAIPAEGSIELRLEPTPADGPGVSWQRWPTGSVQIDLDARPFATLRLDEPTKPFVYPLNGPGGIPLTRHYPMVEDIEGEAADHPHQRSFWFTHGSVNGHDYWGADPLNRPSPRWGDQRVRNLKVTGATSRPGSSLVRIEHDTEWVARETQTIDCTDHRALTFYGHESPRFIDVEITLRASHGPVVLGDTKEGAFGVRVAGPLSVNNQQGGQIRNAEGLTDAATWGQPSAWVDYSGQLEGQPRGITILDRPDSFRHPTTWHVRDYGLFAANPFGQTDFQTGRPGEHTIPEGESIRLAYRVVLHAGLAGADTPEAWAQALARPPAVSLVPSSGDD